MFKFNVIVFVCSLLKAESCMVTRRNQLSAKIKALVTILYHILRKIEFSTCIGCVLDLGHTVCSDPFILFFVHTVANRLDIKENLNK